jgi:hypothetical protein
MVGGREDGLKTHKKKKKKKGGQDPPSDESTGKSRKEGGREGRRAGGTYLVDTDDPVFRGESFLECGELDILDGDDLVAGPVEAGEGGREGGREGLRRNDNPSVGENGIDFKG